MSAERHCRNCVGPNPYAEWPKTAAYKSWELARQRHELFLVIAGALRLEQIATWLSKKIARMS